MAHRYLCHCLPWIVISIFSLACINPCRADQTAEPSYAAMADLLENDQSRARLIEELRIMASHQKPGIASETGVLPVLVPSLNLPARIADGSRTFAENLVKELDRTGAALLTLGNAQTKWNWGELAAQGLHLGALIIATVVMFLLLRRFERVLLSQADNWALNNQRGGNPLLKRAAAVAWVILLDALVIVAAWVGGYSLALFAMGKSGHMDWQASLFLNAFLVVEAFKMLIRALFASRHDGLRILPLKAEAAAYWNAWLARLSGFIGYGMLMVVPLTDGIINAALGRVVALLIMIVAFLYALIIILQNRANVAARLQWEATRASSAWGRVAFGLMARLWHLFAIGYFGVLALVTLLRPADALPLMLRATLQTLLAMGGGAFLAALLTQIISRRWQLPEDARSRFPLLELRLNSYVPTALKLMRAMVVLGVTALVLDAWGLFNLTAWLASEGGIKVISKTLTVAIMLIFMTLVWVALASWIEYRLNPLAGMAEPSSREKTLLTIFRNAVAVVLSITTTMTVLAEIGIDIAPLIAGAGVVGLAIGFGSQKLVQDIITGVFIQLENAINTGDVVSAGGITGVAEKLTIRSIGLRDMSGTYHLIPFSSVDIVSNFMRDFGYHVGEYGVAYRENTDEVIQCLREAFDELRADPENGPLIVDALDIHGVTALADSSVNVRVRIKTLPGSQWGVGRAYNRLVKRHLDAAGIEIPFPHLTLYFGQNKDGSAPPAPIRLETGS